MLKPLILTQSQNVYNSPTVSLILDLHTLFSTSFTQTYKNWNQKPFSSSVCSDFVGDLRRRSRYAFVNVHLSRDVVL